MGAEVHHQIKMIDNDILTKHVSFSDNTGFYIIQTRLSILTQLCWTTSSEANETARDPMISKFEIENTIIFLIQ